jgi:hypothetical protein
VLPLLCLHVVQTRVQVEARANTLVDSSFRLALLEVLVGSGFENGSGNVRGQGRGEGYFLNHARVGTEDDLMDDFELGKLGILHAVYFID